MNTEELEDIRANIYADPMHYEDPQCLPDLLKKAVDTLGAIATGTDSPQVAAKALRDMSIRAASGIPFGEPAERLYETTLDEDERTGR
jgi:hypothetical protein